MPATAPDRDKALATVMGQIEKQHGKGAVMRPRRRRPPTDRGDPDRLDRPRRGARHRWAAARSVVEIYGPESSGKTTWRCMPCRQRAAGRAASRPSSTPSTPSTRNTPGLGVDIDNLLVSQPDTGEQALEIADMLIRSGAIDVIVIDSVAALVPAPRSRARWATATSVCRPG